MALVDNTARDYFNYSVFGSRVRHEHPSNGRAVAVDAHTAPLQVDTGVAWQLLQEHQPALCAHLSDMGVDGMMTTNPETLGPEYRLPLSELGRAAEGAGQHSILLFSAVPTPAAPTPVPK